MMAMGMIRGRRDFGLRDKPPTPMPRLAPLFRAVGGQTEFWAFPSELMTRLVRSMTICQGLPGWGPHLAAAADPSCACPRDLAGAVFHGLPWKNKGIRFAAGRPGRHLHRGWAVGILDGDNAGSITRRAAGRRQTANVGGSNCRRTMSPECNQELELSRPGRLVVSRDEAIISARHHGATRCRLCRVFSEEWNGSTAYSCLNHRCIRSVTLLQLTAESVRPAPVQYFVIRGASWPTSSAPRRRPDSGGTGCTRI